jgi:DNA replication protein DnaC
VSGAATDVAYLTRALKMPRARQVAASLADTARTEGWDYTEFLAKVLAEEVASRDTHGGENRVKAARFPQVKTVDDFDFSHQRSVSRAQISHLQQLDFLREAHNIIFLGPPGTGKTHLSIASASKPPVVAIGWRSPPPPNGSCDSEKPNELAGSPTNWNDSDGSPC